MCRLYEPPSPAAIACSPVRMPTTRPHAVGARLRTRGAAVHAPAVPGHPLSRRPRPRPMHCRPDPTHALSSRLRPMHCRPGPTHALPRRARPMHCRPDPTHALSSRLRPMHCHPGSDPCTVIPGSTRDPWIAGRARNDSRGNRDNCRWVAPGAPTGVPPGAPTGVTPGATTGVTPGAVRGALPCASRCVTLCQTPGDATRHGHEARHRLVR